MDPQKRSERLEKNERGHLRTDLKEVLRLLNARTKKQLETEPFETILVRPILAEDIRALSHLPIEFSLTKLGNEIVLGMGEKGRAFHDNDTPASRRAEFGSRFAHTHDGKIAGWVHAPSTGDLRASLLHRFNNGEPDIIFDQEGVIVYKFSPASWLDLNTEEKSMQKFFENAPSKKDFYKLSEKEARRVGSVIRKWLEGESEKENGTEFYACSWENAQVVSLLMRYFNEEEGWREIKPLLPSYSSDES